MANPSASLTLTCPVCGQTEEAPGSATYSSSVDDKGNMHSWLSYNASAEHECAGIAPLRLERPDA
jgi:hypothetical protein